MLRGKHDYKTILSKLAEVFAIFSFPNNIVSDNGPPYCATELKDYCNRRKLLFIPPYSPQSKGQAERAVQIFKVLLSKFYLSQGKILTTEQILSKYLFAYRMTPSSVTGKSPMAMLLSFKPRSPLSVIKKKVSFDLSRPTTKDSPKLT